MNVKTQTDDPTQFIPIGRGGCIMSVWVVGFLVQKGDAFNLSGMMTASQGRSTMSMGIDRLVSANEVRAMEIYPSGPGTPMEFQNQQNHGCGVVDLDEEVGTGVESSIERRASSVERRA
ncbi:MAG: hypothetical protein M3373_06430 [Gemmatimonadota bacterium]|nr:hypothetical protein [Gemmatimonadota bacterium]